MGKLQVCILGATGVAGQNVVESLEGHPWFEVSELAASQRTSGMRYSEATKEARFFDGLPENDIMEREVSNVETLDPMDYDLAVSSLPTMIAKIQEPIFARHIPVISTSSAFRYEPDVPILIPEINPDHVKLIDAQKKGRGWRGYICPGPNCTTAGLVITLKPINDAYGVKLVHMVSMQALSGAGEAGLRKTSDYRKKVEMNVLPYIENEEEKVRLETRKVLGSLHGDTLNEAGIEISCSCNRVHVENVHTESVFVDIEKKCSLDEVKRILSNFSGEPQTLKLPSAPKKPIIVLDEPDKPQPKLHGKLSGMTTMVGRLRRDPVFRNGLAYTLTSDNTDRGAGGGAVLTAEYLKVKDYI